jgi:hypothetical protein
MSAVGADGSELEKSETVDQLASGPIILSMTERGAAPGRKLGQVPLGRGGRESFFVLFLIAAIVGDLTSVPIGAMVFLAGSIVLGALLLALARRRQRR